MFHLLIIVRYAYGWRERAVMWFLMMSVWNIVNDRANRLMI